jgi:hypothetical protein
VIAGDRGIFVVGYARPRTALLRCHGMIVGCWLQIGHGLVARKVLP